MASEQSGDASIELAIPETLREWLNDASGEWQIDRDDLIRRLLFAFYIASHGDGSSDIIDDIGITDEELKELLSYGKSTNQSVDNRLREIEQRYSDDLDDVRQRVIQLKRELDGKASESHTHPKLVQQHNNLTESLESLARRIESTEEALERVTQQVDDGFDNYRSILENLVERTEELQDRVDTIASVVVRYRDDLNEVSELIRNERQLSLIAQEANKNGVRTAKCDQCNVTVDISLLTKPTCPECTARFESLVPKEGFFGKSRLSVEEPPALETGERIEGFEFGRSSKIDDVKRDSNRDSESET